MKTTNVTLTFDADKLDALVFHLERTGGSVESELEIQLQKLYEKNVPAAVRAFIERNSKLTPKKAKRQPRTVPDLRSPSTPLSEKES